MLKIRFVCTFSLLLLSSTFLMAQQPASLEARIQAIMQRPAFAHSRFGIEFFSADTGRPIYELNQNELFVPGSTTKLLTEGTALETLGGDYRFHTRIYRAGEVKKHGVLKGDLILVAGGDPDLSNRIQPDGTLAFENEDHSYGGEDSRGFARDPLLVLHELAGQIAEKGIKRIDGRVLIDISLFPQGPRELGTGVVISPIVVNDNLVDVIVTPGQKPGEPVNLQVSPKTAYVSILNRVATAAPGGRVQLDYVDERTNADGTRSVTLSGSIPAGHAPVMNAYPVPEPDRYAAALLTEALRDKGVEVRPPKKPAPPDFSRLAAGYTPENLLAEHISLPLREDVRITLKVSQNLHASMTPYLLGALVAHQKEHIRQAGFDVENAFLRKAGLDLTAAAQSDGAGGDAFFTPAFIVSYLNYMRQQKDFADFRRGLPILGRDGTLAKIQVNSTAAGHVFAKTGTYGSYDALNKDLLVTGKGLAGYMETSGGEHLIFALYVNMVPVSLEEPEAAQKIAGEALGEIASAAWENGSR